VKIPPRNIVCLAFTLIGAGFGCCFNQHSLAPVFLGGGGFFLGLVVPMHNEKSED
jgi:hypothetical protein